MSESATPAQDTKRRLAPQVSFKPDPSYENGKKNSDGPRKTVIRFTREVLIAKRKPSSLMACMAALADVVSEQPSDPVCFETLEPEDVIRIWNAAKANHDASRGRGRSRINRDNEDGMNNTRGNDIKDLWDAEDTSAFDGKPFDFSKVAEESEKFRSELDNMKKSKHALNEDPHKMEEIDMDSLIIGDSEKANTGNKQEKETPVETGKMTKIEFGSLLTSANQNTVNNSAAAFSIQGYDSTFATTKDTNSSLLSKIGVNLETTTAAPVATAFVAPVPPKRTAKWFYRDPSNQIQGPFQQSSMHQWNKEGYFSPDLPIQADGWSKFYPFIEVFPNSVTAFEHVPDEPLPILPGLNSFTALNNVPSASSNINSSASANNSHISLAKEPSSATGLKFIVKTREAPKQQQQQQYQPAKTDVDRSNIAKKLLGLSSDNNTASQQPVAVETAPVEEKPQQKNFEQNKKNQRVDRDEHKSQQQQQQQQQQQAAAATKATNETANSGEVSPKPNKGWNKDAASDARGKVAPAAPTNLLSIQEEQRIAAQQQSNTNVSSNNVSAAPTGAASLQLKSFLGINASKALGINNSSAPKGWSSSSSNSSKSLQEIMSEEMSQKQAELSQLQAQGAAQVQQQHQHQQHLAQQALARQQQMQSHSWASKAARPTPNAPPSAVSVPTVLSRNTPVAAANTASTAPVPSAKPSPARTNNTTSNKSNFGGKAMTAEMSEWCASQLKKMNYSEQSEVLDFCMSLKSPVEIRETLSTYLGSTPQVTNFATDFIRYKEEGRRPSGEPSGAADIKRVGPNTGVGVQNKKKTAK